MRVVEIQCKICTFRNKVYPPYSSDYEFKLSSRPCLGGVSHALREENRILFNQMLGECKRKEYLDCVNSKSKSLSAESLFLVLILEQQKMINEMMGALRQDSA
jgi:hypothetical protein